MRGSWSVGARSGLRSGLGLKAGSGPTAVSGSSTGSGYNQLESSSTTRSESSNLYAIVFCLAFFFFFFFFFCLKLWFGLANGSVGRCSAFACITDCKRRVGTLKN